MAGKRTKKNKAEETNIQTTTQEESIMTQQNNSQTKKETIMEQGTNTQSTIDAILTIDNTIWEEEDLQGLPLGKLEKILEAEKARAEAFAENIILKASKASKSRKKEIQFTKAARIVQRFLEDTETVHHTIMERIVQNPSVSGKEINETFGIKYGGTCVHHTRVLLNVLYNNGLLNPAVVEELEEIMAETE